MLFEIAEIVSLTGVIPFSQKLNNLCNNRFVLTSWLRRDGIWAHLRLKNILSEFKGTKVQNYVKVSPG